MADRSLQADLWATIKDARDVAANRLNSVQAELDQLNSLLSRMKAAGMNSHLPTMEDVQRAWRESGGPGEAKPDDETSSPASGDPSSGWVLVPLEPTPEAVAAWWRVKNGHHHHDEPPPTDTSDYAAYRALVRVASGGPP